MAQLQVAMGAQHEPQHQHQQPPSARDWDDAARELIPTPSPSSDQDWEKVKPIIEDLYINRSLALKDVDDIMRTSYNFKASQKMYKRRFVKWNWHKYKTKPHSSVTLTTGGTRSSRGPRGGKRATIAVRRQILPKTLLESDSSHQITTILSLYRGFIKGWCEQDPRSVASRELGINAPFHKTQGYNPAMISHFFLAVNHFNNNEHRQGGRALRCAFLELEDLVMDGHINTVWDCCITVPGLAVNYGLTDVLMTFLRYLARLTAAKARNHPLTTISRNLYKFAHEHYDQTQQYMQRSMRIWTDSLIPIIGRDNINTLDLKRAFLIIQKHADPVLVKEILEDYERLIKLGADDDTKTLNLEFDMLSVQLRHGTLTPDFETRVESLVSRVATKWEDVKYLKWPDVDRQIYYGCWAHLELVAEARGDSEKAAFSREHFLAAADEVAWVQYALRMEDRLRKAGKDALADMVEARRQEVQLPKNIIKVLEEEEQLAEEQAVSESFEQEVEEI